MPLILKGTAPGPGETDKRYYMMDVQVGKRRERLSTGTRDKDLATRKMREVSDLLAHNPQVSKDDLRALLRGELKAAAIARQQSRGLSLKEVADQAAPVIWSELEDQHNIRINLRHIFDGLGSDTPIERIDTPAIDNLVRHLRSERKNSNATINRKLSLLSGLLEYAVTRGIIKAKPHIPRQGNANRSREFTMDAALMDRFLAAVRARDAREQSVKGGHPIKRDAERYAVFFEFLFETGLRPGEARQLRWDAVDLRGGFLDVRHDRAKGLKTKNKRSRSIPITTRCRIILERELDNGRPGPFTDLTNERANDHWRGAREALGIDDADCVPYATRHSVATRIIEETGDLHLAKEWLGHTNIQVTSNIYAHVQKKYLERAAGALNTRRHLAPESETELNSLQTCTDREPS